MASRRLEDSAIAAAPSSRKQPRTTAAGESLARSTSAAAAVEVPSVGQMALIARYPLGDVEAHIQEFSRAILDVDVDPPRQAGETRDAARIRVQCTTLGLDPVLLRAPLPYDCASHTVAGSGVSTAVSMPQLLHTRGEDADRFIAQLLGSTSGSQAPKVVIASAASGVGKTHLAYAAGHTHFLTIVIRVVTMDTANTLSLPMQWLRDYLAATKAIDGAGVSSSSDVAVIRSQAVSRAMRLVILAHVHVLAIALAHVRTLRRDGLDKAHARELSLRLFRNGTADRLVAAALEKLYALLRTTADAPALDDTRMKDYEDRVTEGFRHVNQGQPLLLAVDEAHMINDHTDLIPFKSLVVSARDRVRRFNKSPHLRTATRNQRKRKSPPAARRRDLFYELVVTLDVLSADHAWVAYVTGTRFTMLKVSDRETSASLGLRMQPLQFAPSFMMDTNNMISLLKYYFAFDDAFFGAEDVCKALSRFSGRPLLFQSGVWSAVMGHILAKYSLPSPDMFMALLGASNGSIAELWHQRFKDYFHRNVAIVSDGSGVRALLPELAIAATSPSGMFSAQKDDALEVAVLEGFFPVSSRVREFDMHREPLVYDALGCALRDSARSGVFLHALARSSRPASVSDKGPRMELVLAWHIALERWCALDDEDITLGDVLRSMGDCVCQDQLPECVDEWYTNVRRAEDAKQQCPLSLLYDATTSIVRDDVILYNIDNAMGVDIAFVVSRAPAVATAVATREYKLVVLQVKNAVSSSTLRAALLTLHPGTQYVSNDERAALVKDPTSSRVLASKNWRAYHDKYTNVAVWPRFLFEGWFRIAAVARLQTPEMQQLANEECTIDDEADAAAHLRASAVILLFMHARRARDGADADKGGEDADWFDADKVLDDEVEDHAGHVDEATSEEDEIVGDEIDAADEVGDEDDGSDGDEDLEVHDGDDRIALSRTFEEVCLAVVGRTKQQLLREPRGDDALRVFLPISVDAAAEAVGRARPPKAGQKRNATTAAGSSASPRRRKRT